MYTSIAAPFLVEVKSLLDGQFNCSLLLALYLYQAWTSIIILSIYGRRPYTKGNLEA